MIPVLAVQDPALACHALSEHFGFTGDATRMTLGGQSIVLTTPGALPRGFVPLRLDHVALSVADADATHRAFLARGAKLHTGLTPEGPKNIPEFWEHGVRFVFFEGPEGWPLEFCARNGAPAEAVPSHSHYGIRCRDMASTLAQVKGLGAQPLASHRLGQGNAQVHVEFLALGSVILELFDEAPFPEAGATGWIGLAP